ncbi:MAG TPA: class I SAM-dependent methyltransferase [Candidatus Ozemobacteraceae bacterium]|nr:class I SAM-dependent methyltransferase [Candidatus Ozemobacteraceae bacterium]
MTDIGVGSMIYRGDIYDKMNPFISDLSFFEKWSRQSRGDVLELCCGTGRLTIPLHQAGIPISGLDITPTMLDAARAKCAKAGLQIPLHQGDIRTFDLAKKFSLIFIPFNSLQHTYSIEDLEAVFSRVKAHLNPDGLFIFDVFNPSIHMMVDREREIGEAFRFPLDDGRELVVRERCHYDAGTQINQVTWFFRIDQEEEHPEQLHMRCFFPLELTMALKYNGFSVVHRFGAFDESPFTSASPKQIFVCRANA